MLCKLVAELPKENGWMYEVVRGGRRSIVVKDGRQVDVFAENGKRLRCPEAEQAAREVHPKTAVIDCELVALSPHNGASGKTDLRLYAFDLLHVNGRDLTGQPLERRKAQLCSATLDTPVLFSPLLSCDPDQLVEEVRQLSLEGVIAKLKGSLYEPGKRTDAWLKMRVNSTRRRARTQRRRLRLVIPARRAALRVITRAREGSRR